MPGGGFFNFPSATGDADERPSEHPRACAPCNAGAQWEDPPPLRVYHYVGLTGLR
jgi:hypothetical protein